MYSESADLYDRLTGNIDYPAYAGYFIDLLKKHSPEEVHTLLELGCGSGSLTRILSSAGYDMTGVDGSHEMLSEAYSKEGAGILWINQNALDLDLFGTYDAAISFLDFPNHLTGMKDLETVFMKLHNFLNPGGLYIFDINSEYKFNNILADNVFYYDDDDYSCIWQNKYDDKTKICKMDLTVFRREGELFRRSDAANSERAYSVGDIKSASEKAGMKVIALYGDMSFEPPEEKAERIFIVCRKE